MIGYFSSDWIFQENPQTSFSIGSFNGTEEVSLNKLLKNIYFRKFYRTNKNISEILKENQMNDENIFSLEIILSDINLDPLFILKKNLTLNYTNGIDFGFETNLSENDIFTLEDVKNKTTINSI